MKIGSIVECVNNSVLEENPHNHSLALLKKGGLYTVERMVWPNGLVLSEVKSSHITGSYRRDRFREIEFPPSLEAQITESLSPQLA